MKEYCQQVSFHGLHFMNKLSWHIIHDNNVRYFLAWWNHSFTHRQKCDSPQNPAMPIYRPANKNTIAAILAQRLLQAACIMSWSFLRLITSDKTSIEYSSQFQSQQTTPIIGNASPYKDNATHDTGNAHHWQGWPRHWQGMSYAGRARNLFFYGGWMPPTPYPMRPCAAAPNAETPLLRKTAFLCNAYLYASLPCSYADPCYCLMLRHNVVC